MTVRARFQAPDVALSSLAAAADAIIGIHPAFPAKLEECARRLTGVGAGTEEAHRQVFTMVYELLKDIGSLAEESPWAESAGDDAESIALNIALRAGPPPRPGWFAPRRAPHAHEGTPKRDRLGWGQFVAGEWHSETCTLTGNHNLRCAQDREMLAARGEMRMARPRAFGDYFERKAKAQLSAYLKWRDTVLP